MLANTLDLGERDIVAAADQQHLALVAAPLEVADELDRIGLTEREVEYDQLRGRLFD